MIEMPLSQAAELIGATLLNGTGNRFCNVHTDSRHITSQSLFVALAGERFDAHDYVAQADAAGAAAVMVDRPVDVQVPQLRVDDTRLGMGRLAAAWKASLDIKTAGITGSNGKTTNKEMTAAILACSGQTLATNGNFNNDIGVPLTLFRLSHDDRYAVVEMGANHHGEIAYLSNLVKADAVMVTNAGPAHLEGFGDLDGVARAKGEIFESLAVDGVAIVNADDHYADEWRHRAGDRRIVDFGLDKPAMFSATYKVVGQGVDMSVATPMGSVVISLPLPGRHNVLNALGSMALATSLGASLDQCKQGLETLLPVTGRLMAREGIKGTRIFDDTYNANPASFGVAMDVLVEQPGESWMVLGDMGELGANTERLHHQVGELAAVKGIDRVYALGELARDVLVGFSGDSQHFDDIDRLIAAIKQDISGDQSILIKGSRSMRMERVVDALVENSKLSNGEDS